MKVIKIEILDLHRCSLLAEESQSTFCAAGNAKKKTNPSFSPDLIRQSDDDPRHTDVGAVDGALAHGIDLTFPCDSNAPKSCLFYIKMYPKWSSFLYICFNDCWNNPFRFGWLYDPSACDADDVTPNVFEGQYFGPPLVGPSNDVRRLVGSGRKIDAKLIFAPCPNCLKGSCKVKKHRNITKQYMTIAESNTSRYRELCQELKICSEPLYCICLF